ncbi:Fic family protein [Avibacterium paragallinarum]|uniref:Fic family protein n=1 Tax=Avibacterium paragallinarum TaxID=728 RepID=UPI00021AD09D|nr:Fic family protein [Avibacterium paragallinarum]AZI13429.1 Fic family protein [Avibacterium paragallinarum]QIR12894.1 Fic family protein [Avibacterium paragallinarum]QLD66019.1 Fic family protein [Avibacterium paragallinarum]UXN34629.1 Fic family protein [Avibacterium paragallinarum]
MKISKPKPIEELFNRSWDKSQILSLGKYKPTDEKGRYLHWHKIKYKYSREAELAWLGTKLSRAALLSPLQIGSEVFSYATPKSLLSLLHFIDKTTGGSIGASNLAGLGKVEQSAFLLKSLIMEEAISSAQLEGASTTRKVAKEMLRSERKPKTKDEIMIVNNYLLMKEALALKDSPLTPEMILAMHRTATNNAIENNAVSGQFRSDDEIHIADYDGNIIHQPPKHTEISELIQALCDFANTSHSGESGDFIHPVIKAIILHFLIGYIHPFGDGNGRTARAIFYWYMLKSGYWLFEYVSISRLLKVAPAKYARAFIYTETDDLDMTYFIYHQAETIKRAILELESYINNKQRNFKAFSGAIVAFTTKKQVKFNRRQIQILQKAVKESGAIFTAKEVSNELGISENTARSDLNALLNFELLGVIKSGRAIFYIAPNDLIERLKGD